MRFSSKAFCRKFNQIRKQNWSAPTIMSVFIIICMICIFSLESLGLLDNTKNINHRLTTPEISVKITNEEKKISSESFVRDLENSIKKANIKTKIQEKKVTALNDLLLDAATYQMDYESKHDSMLLEMENNYKTNDDDNSTLLFFDL